MRVFRWRLFVSWALLAAAIGASAAPHRHLLLEDDSPTGAPERTVLTTHAGRSTTHWHAVIRVIHADPCWACHWQRHVGLASAVETGFELSIARVQRLLPPRAAVSVARFSRSTRAPPSLL